MNGRILIIDGNDLQGHRYEASQLHQSMKRHGDMNAMEHAAAQNQLVDIEQQIRQMIEN
jgi:hypothetical protein